MHLLSGHPLFSSESADEIGHRLGAFYNDSAVTIEPVRRDRKISLGLFGAPLDSIVLDAMSWPLGVHAEAPCLEETFDFCTVTHGSAQVTVEKEKVSCGGETGFVLSPSRRMSVRADDHMQVFNIKVPQPLIEAQLRALTGRQLDPPLQFETALRFQQGPIDSVWRFIQWIESEFGRIETILSNPLVCAHLCETVITALLQAQPHNYSQLLHQEVRAAEPHYVREVEEYIAAHCDQPISARDLARIASVSMSALYAGFKRYRGCTPLEFLKNTRLRRIRDELLVATPGTKISEVAARWGFNHAGRFSQEYGRRFGEKPAETLSRSTAR